MNGDFCCNVRHEYPVKRRNNLWAPHHDSVPAQMSHSLCSRFRHEQKGQSPPTLPTHHPSPSVIFSYFQKINWRTSGSILSVQGFQAKLQDVMKMLMHNDFHQRFWSQKFAEITVLLQNGNTRSSREMGANKNSSKCLILGRRISETFELHLIIWCCASSVACYWEQKWNLVVCRITCMEEMRRIDRWKKISLERPSHR
jgi:hypothetical protein